VIADDGLLRASHADENDAALRVVAAALTIVRAFVVAPDRQEVLDKVPPYCSASRHIDEPL